jgi:hypothetical protein
MYMPDDKAMDLPVIQVMASQAILGARYVLLISLHAAEYNNELSGHTSFPSEMPR